MIPPKYNRDDIKLCDAFERVEEARLYKNKIPYIKRKSMRQYEDINTALEIIDILFKWLDRLENFEGLMKASNLLMKLKTDELLKLKNLS